jgi:hypothetical protein
MNLGYVSFDEALAVLRAARRRGITKITVTSPLTSGGLREDQLLELMHEGDLSLELTCYSMHPSRAGGADVTPEGAVRLIRRVGVSRCVLSSDAGTASAPPVGDLLAWGLSRLAEQGLKEAELRALVHTNPAALLA